MSKWKERWKYATELRPDPMPQKQGEKEHTFLDGVSEFWLVAAGGFALILFIVAPILWAFGLLGAIRGIIQFLLN